MTRHPAATVLLLLVLLPCCGGSSGGLGGIRAAVRGGGSGSGGSGGGGSSGGSSGGAGFGSFEDMGTFLGLFLSSPFWLPHVALDDSLTGIRGYFLPYPYASGEAGSVKTLGSHLPAPLSEARRYSSRLLVENYWDAGDIRSLRGRFVFTTTSRFGFDAALTRMEEDLGGGVTDRLSIGRAHVLFRFAQGPSAQMRVGLGGTWMSDDVGTEGGFEFVYEGDFFPRKPIVLSGSIGLGALGEASVFHLRATVGAMLGRWEAFAGYDLLEVDSVTVSGPGLGVRCWF